MRAELAAIENTQARRRFARSAAAAAFGQGFGLRIALVLVEAVIVAAAALTASRVQLEYGGPGVLGVTVPTPALALLVIAFLAAHTARSFRFGLETGALALIVGFGALFAVLAVEGQVWMERHGVFMLDGDPTRHAVMATDVALDVFSTGMWVGHVVFWLPWPVIGAALGAHLGARPNPVERTVR